LAGLAVLAAGAIAARLWLTVAYGPAFVGFNDSHEYLTAAVRGAFSGLQKPAGYAIYLEFSHLLGFTLALTVLVQHALGLATGILLYLCVARTAAPSWLGLFPAAVVFFGGTGLLLEHSLLADPLFAFTQALWLYAAMRALDEPRLRWPLLAGIAVGCSFWLKTVGVVGVLIVPPVLLAGARGDRGARRRAAALAAASALAIVLGYVAVQGIVSGYWGYERQGAWNLYGRVATFVDCAHFAPPSGTRFLCPAEPLSHRNPEAYYQYARTAPAVRRYGGPARAPAAANAELQRFSLAAIEQQPDRYAASVLRGLAYFVSPRAGEGYTPASLRDALLEPRGTASIQAELRNYYGHSHGYAARAGSAPALDFYERHTRVEGALLIAMLAAALAGVSLLGGRERWASVLLTLAAVASALLAVAGNSYDARYAYPTFGPLAAAAALGGWAIVARVRRRRGPTRRARYAGPPSQP